MRFSNGYIKLERELINQFEGDACQLGLFTILLSNANWDDLPTKFTKMGKSYEVNKGQFITTYLWLQGMTGLSFRTLKARVNGLVESGHIHLTSLKNCILIDIRIDIYQSKSIQNSNANEEYKNIRINKNSPKGEQKESPSEQITLPLNSKDQVGVRSENENKPNKKKSNRSKNPKKAPPIDLNTNVGTLTLLDIKKAWNDHSGDLPNLRGFNKKRLLKFQTCSRELDYPELDFFSTAIKNLARSKWAIEQRVDFDWMFNSSTTVERAFNGYYNREFKTPFQNNQEPTKPEERTGTIEKWKKENPKLLHLLDPV